MPSPVKTVLWQVDVQRDFMLPGGALYVQGAERLIPNIHRLVGLARSGNAFLISSACQHSPNDPEFSVFPPHCLRGTPGADLIPEARGNSLYTVPNDGAFALPGDLLEYEQVMFEKQNIDVFSNPHVARVVGRFARDTEFIVFGVVTEYCVRMAANGLLDRGYRVAVVEDAIETLDKQAGAQTIAQLAARGARLVLTSEVGRRAPISKE
ncbi:MAG TPA: isochorismatase family cysteine hydrolase [Bryobacteraceae bacterium]|nr:isochorismatase family cysteine hydrolase [Bryobacteraceae bacterium]